MVSNEDTHLEAGPYDVISCTELSHSLIRKPFLWLKYKSTKESYEANCTI